MGKGKHQRTRERAPRAHDGRGRNAARGQTYWLYGLHAVEAAIMNPGRHCHELRLTRNAEQGLDPATASRIAERGLISALAEPAALEHLLPPGSVHQGIVARVEPLEQPALEDLDIISDHEAPALVIVLDQVTDPHNVGAILRSTAAFGGRAVISQDRHSPPETAALAKAASGALEVVPWVRTVNLARALDALAAAGFWRIGLDGGATQDLARLDMGARIALVLGAEGAGLRHGTREHCDVLAKLPITRAVESLNVSNAAAVALYELARRNPMI